MSCEADTNQASLPKQIVIHQRSRRLELRWPDGHGFSVGHARLRQACPCAWCEGQRRRKPHEAVACDPDVQLSTVTPIGHLGLQLHFSDGHDRGIFPWAFLQSLAEQHAAVEP